MQCYLIIEFSTERDYNSQKKTNEERECRTELMGLKHPLKHRKNNNTESNQFEKLGCLLSGTQNRWSVDFIRKEGPYKCFIIDCSN